jgi:hypothetical protein
MQSVLVEKADNYAGGGALRFPAAIGVTGTGSQLRAAAATVTGDKLDIVARNTTAAVRTFIAKREEGGDTFGSRDARKLIDAIGNIPEVYTLKPLGTKMIATAANIINSDDLVIPAGIATARSGEIILAFTGMDTYNAQITLIDTEANAERDLTGLSAYEYTFNYTPNLQNGQVIANEDRFFIRFSPANVTGLGGDVARHVSTTTVYASRQTIHIVSPDPVREISVYTPQGILVYNAADVNTIKNVTPGIYIVKAVTAKGVKTTKLMVQ